jgi:hypothetical protein
MKGHRRGNLNELTSPYSPASIRWSISPLWASSKVKNKNIIVKGFVVLAIAVAIGAFHISEDMAQVIQKFIPDLESPHDHHHGSEVNIEPFHFAYNVIYLGLVVYIWLIFRDLYLKEMRLVKSLIILVLIGQSWYFIENYMKLDQYFMVGCISCPGILTSDTNLVLLHLAYNFIVYVPLVAAYVVYHYQTTPYRRVKAYQISKID